MKRKRKKSNHILHKLSVLCTILTLYLLPFHNYQNPHYHHDPGSIKKKIPKLNIKFIFLIWKAYAYINSYYKNSELYKIRYSNNNLNTVLKYQILFRVFAKKGGVLVGRRMVKQGRGRGGGLLSFPIDEL